MKYRPDVDGLRAIAILFVLLFHAGLKKFSCGFIGVDIFFVISGFLITGIIHNALQNNHFSFVDFYSRRLWRMQPVFICLIVVCTLITLFYYLPDDLILYTKSVRKSSLFVSNLFLERITVNYFAPNTQQIPLLHTWSLSIEWQCYFTLPIAIYLLHRFFAKETIVKIIYLLTLLFFALSCYFSLYHSTKAYFHLPNRVFEFLIGSCIAVKPNLLPGNKYFLNTIGMIALSLLFYMATRSDLGTGYPNYNALILCIATGTLIAVGEQRPQSFPSRLLSIKPLVLIGLISYSLYIWHWPLFAFMRYLYVEETTLVLLLVFSVIFIVAWLSWHFIEKPARKLHTTKFTYTLIGLFILPVILTNLGDRIIKKEKGYPERFQKLNKMDEQLKKYESIRRTKCLQPKNVAINKNCVLGANNPNSRTGFMIGDSFSNHHWRFMERLAQNSNLSILAHSTAACLTLPGIFQSDWKAKDDVFKDCHEQTKHYYTMIRKNHYDFVIIGQHWDGYLTRGNIVNHLSDKRSNKLTKERIEKALNKAIQIIIASGSKPVIIKSIALSKTNPYDCFYSHIKLRRKYNSEQCDFNLQPKEQQWFDDLFAKMKSNYSELIIIDPKQVQCPKGRCKAAFAGLPVFRDPGHLTDYASYHMAGLYLKQFKNPLIS